MRGRWVKLVLAAVALVAAFAGWRLWYGWAQDQSVARMHFYARALDEAAARAAGPQTPGRFIAFAPPPPGETTGPSIPCGRDQKQLRAAGAGRCLLFNYGASPRPKPAICRLAPCLFLTLNEADWRDPAIRAAVESLRRDPGAPCRALDRETDAGWRREGPRLAGDCGAWRRLKGVVFIALLQPDPTRSGTPPAMQEGRYRFIRAL